MLDLKAIREDPEPYRHALARRGAAEALDRVLLLDEERRSLTVRVEALRAEQNRGSKEVAQASGEDKRELIAKLREVSAELKTLEPELARVEEELQHHASRLPNVPDPTAPDGRTEEDNVVVKEVGEKRGFDFQPLDHLALGEALGMIDTDRGVRTSGARFAYLMGPAARLQFALVRYAFDFTDAYGYTPVVPPVLVREEAMFGTGFLPTDEAQIYLTRDDDLYLVGTSEVPLAALHMGEILEPADLPQRYLGYSTCFRREAGTYGKDTRGIFRVHQFDKLEMFSFVLPSESGAEHERLLAIEEAWVQSLEIPYRVVNVCIGDLGGPAAKKYDIEAWLPAQGKYREITSTSNTTDFQARRLDCRVRLPEGNRPLHTLNGTLSAIGRTIIALLENGQRSDGSVVLPSALHPYLAERDHVLTPPR
ncbi:MAG TPA: serine--tRNA ligase [Actinobacteria bacterium]|nr:serine--tRNA ligase [Actinomycetota bacterium]HCP61671.1 serine--tRNA ligase [Actinomycetota bacterium]